MFRRMIVAITALAVGLAPAMAIAQDIEPVEATGPNLNWVFQLAVVILVGFVLFLAFVGLYYALAVVARNRRFATQAPATTSRTASARTPEPAGVAAQAPAQPAARAQPAPAEAPAQPQAAPAPEKAPEQPAAAAPAAQATAPAATGGLPKIDPNNLPDGIDAVMRGRLKKLSVLQERGQEPPADLVEELKPVLEQIAGGPIDAAAAPAQQAAPAQEAPAEQAEAPAPAAEPAPAAAEAAPAAEPAEPQPAADTGGLPRIDPNNLPDGIDAVARGRLKKLAIFQERGQAPPAELVENLKPILDQMSG